jgi:hypothetical protein
LKATVLDTVTGVKKIKDGPRSSDWHEGNYACDCNREIIFNIVMEEEESICIGCKRFLVVNAEFNDPDDYKYTLRELNDGYSEELLKKHGILK